MVKVEIGSNDAGQRLDRFLRKYLKRAPLSAVYKIIRKDLKLNGKRAKEDTVLKEGDVLSLFIDEEKLSELTKEPPKRRAKRQFTIAYEDDNVLIVGKPWGLLTHGDSHEKKNTLMNQVCGYLQDKGQYDPAGEKSYTIGYTRDEYLGGVSMPWEVFANFLATGAPLEDYRGMTTYAQVDTGDPNVTLNLRKEPNTSCAVLAEVPCDTKVRVLLSNAEWSYVACDGTNGYLLNQYLQFPEGQDPAVNAENAQVAADESTIPAEVHATTEKKAPVFAEDSGDAQVLGHLEDGVRVEVLETVDGWSHIRLEGHEGYMKDADLQFLLADEVVT